LARGRVEVRRLSTLRRIVTRRIPGGRTGRETGFTLFELIVVICIVATMAGILLNRLRVYQEAAEKAAMQQTAAAIKSALQMRVASYLINGRGRKITPASFTPMPTRALRREAGIST
jgi:type II secretory pathway pseudopilin PulG